MSFFLFFAKTFAKLLGFKVFMGKEKAFALTICKKDRPQRPDLVTWGARQGLGDRACDAQNKMWQPQLEVSLRRAHCSPTLEKSGSLITLGFLIYLFF